MVVLFTEEICGQSSWFFKRKPSNTGWIFILKPAHQIKRRWMKLFIAQGTGATSVRFYPRYEGYLNSVLEKIPGI
jgi:hypothetical protein